MDGEQRQKVVVGLREHGTKKQSRVSDAGVHMPSANYATQTRRAVKAVDEDLYVIPPDMLCHKPRVNLPSYLITGPWAPRSNGVLEYVG